MYLTKEYKFWVAILEGIVIKRGDMRLIRT